MSTALNKVKGFHHNALRVADIDRSVKFYEGLGFKLRDIYTNTLTGEKYALLRLENGNGLLLCQAEQGNLPTDIERMRAAGSMFQYCFWLEKAEYVDAIYEHCLGIGARERIKPFWHEAYGLSHWEDRPAFVYGPDEEILEFLYIDYKEKTLP